MNKFISCWAEFVVKRRWLVLSISFLLIGLSFIPMQSIEYDNSSESYFVQGDPNLDSFNQLLELFGDVEYLSIGIRAADGDTDVFTPQTLQVVHELTEFLEKRPEVTQVRSISKYEYTHSGGGMMSTDPLIDDIHDSDAASKARLIIRGEPMALGTLVTEDLGHTRVIARVRYQVDSSTYKVALTTAVREFIEQQQYLEQGYKLHLSGQPVFSEQFEMLTKRDQAWINPTMAVVMILILFFSFRSLTGMLMPWTVIGTAIVLVTGLQGLLGWPHSIVESALIPALIIIGVGISVHVLVEFYHFRARGLEPPAAATAAVAHLWVPGFYTAFTTAAGFLALAATELEPVRQFALLGAMGAMVLFLIAITLMPAFLSFIHSFPPRTRRAIGTGFVANITERLPNLTQWLRKPITALGVLLLVGSLWVIPDIRVDSNFITYFKKDNTTRLDLLYFDKHYNGIQNVDIVIDSGEDGGIHNPAFLQQVEKLQSWLEQQPESGNVNSLLDFHKQINQALHFDQPEWHKLPDNRQMAAQFLLLYDNTGPEEDLTDAKDFYERYLRIALPITNMPASATDAFLDRVRGHLKHKLPKLDVQLTGGLVMSNAQDNYINRGMISSFSIALAIIGLSFIVLFRSVKYGLIALIPSIVPILMTGALLVLLDIPLNLGTMIVGAMTMGIAVDDSIHVMNRYLLARRQGSSAHQAVVRAMTETGRAVVFTSIVLVTGFSVMLLGSFIPYIYTGLFAATIMALALLGDLIFLPALIYLVDGCKANSPQCSDAATQEAPSV